MRGPPRTFNFLDLHARDHSEIKLEKLIFRMRFFVENRTGLRAAGTWLRGGGRRRRRRCRARKNRPLSLGFKFNGKR